MRVVFCGNPEFALPTLEALLLSSHDVCAVVCSPDKPRGRGLKVTPLPVKERAQAAGLSVFQPASLRDGEFLSAIHALHPDCLVVVGFRILPRELYALPRLGSFNVHPSLLPRGRGAAPIRWTLIRGETVTGVTIFRLTDTIDGGDVLMQRSTPVEPYEDFGSLYPRLATMGARLLVEVLESFDRGQPPPSVAQDESQVTKAPKLAASDFEINWTMSATEIHHRIRAFSPSPGAVTRAGAAAFKILSAEAVAEPHDLACGQVLRDGRDGLMVGTGEGAIRLKIVQPEGKRPMAVAEFLRGRPKLPERFGE